MQRFKIWLTSKKIFKKLRQENPNAAYRLSNRPATDLYSLARQVNYARLSAHASDPKIKSFPLRPAVNPNIPGTSNGFSAPNISRSGLFESLKLKRETSKAPIAASQNLKKYGILNNANDFGDRGNKQPFITYSPTPNKKNVGDKKVGQGIFSSPLIKYSPALTINRNDRVYSSKENTFPFPIKTKANSGLQKEISKIQPKKFAPNENLYNELEINCQPKDWAEAAEQRFNDSFPHDSGIDFSPRFDESAQEDPEEEELVENDELWVPFEYHYSGLDAVDTEFDNPEFEFLISKEVGHLMCPPQIHRIIALLRGSKEHLDIEKIKSQYKSLYGVHLSSSELNRVLVTNSTTKLARSSFSKCPILGLFDVNTGSNSKFGLANNGCLGTMDIKTLNEIRERCVTATAYTGSVACTQPLRTTNTPTMSNNRSSAKRQPTTIIPEIEEGEIV